MSKSANPGVGQMLRRRVAFLQGKALMFDSPPSLDLGMEITPAGIQEPRLGEMRQEEGSFVTVPVIHKPTCATHTYQIHISNLT